MRKTAWLLVGVVLITVGLTAMPISETIGAYAEQNATSATAAIQLTFLIAYACVIGGILITRPSFARLGGSPLYFLLIVAGVGIMLYVAIGALLGG